MIPPISCGEAFELACELFKDCHVISRGTSNPDPSVAGHLSGRDSDLVTVSRPFQGKPGQCFLVHHIEMNCRKVSPAMNELGRVKL